MTNEMRNKVTALFSAEPSLLNTATDIQHKLFLLWASGLTQKQIAQKLSVAPWFVSARLKPVLDRLVRAVHSREHRDRLRVENAEKATLAMAEATAINYCI
jgi:DNA-binding NarL/FixJ family response regulator